jgi:hypothetical protein
MDPLGGISQNNNFIIEMRKNRELQQAMASSLSESKRKAEEVVGSPTWYQKLRREQQDNQRTELARTSITASLTGGTAGLAVAPSPTTVIPNSTTPSSSNTSSVRIEQGSIDALSAALTRALLNAKIGIYVDKKKVGEVAYDLLRDGTIPAIISRN